MCFVKVKVKIKVILRATVSRPVRPGIRHSSGTRDQFFPFSLWLFFWQFWVCWCGRPLWREVGSVLFSFCRSSPAQPFSDPSPTGLMSIVYCLYFWDSPNQVKVKVTLRPTVSRPVCPGVRRPSGTCDQFFFLLEISFRQLRVCNFVASSLTRGRVCNLLYNCLELEFVLRPFVFGIEPPLGTHDQKFSSFFSFDNYVLLVPRAPFLTRGRVCSLQWMVSSLMTKNHTLQSHLRLFPEMGISLRRIVFVPHRKHITSRLQSPTC
jgi:hypothetical protein